jgi:hypothetical protein
LDTGHDRSDLRIVAMVTRDRNALTTKLADLRRSLCDGSRPGRPALLKGAAGDVDHRASTTKCERDPFANTATGSGDDSDQRSHDAPPYHCSTAKCGQ